MDNRIQAEQPMPRLELDLGEREKPPAPPKVPRWLIVSACVLAFLFAAFVWPTLYRYEHAGSLLMRINRVTGDAVLIARDVR